MDKNAIKKYAIWARRELISRISGRAAWYGITEDSCVDADADSIDGRVLSATEKKQRAAFILKVQHEGFEQAIEEVAYTWFNRFCALRYMEVNGYLPSHVRVFTDDANDFKPQILDEAIHMEMEGLDTEKVLTYKDANDTEGLYRYLLITQCNALSAILPGMFQKIEDYTELLLPENLLRNGSVIEQMIAEIPEEDWTDQVQIIGWLYQYYNAEKKDEVFTALKKNVKITKENIPAATQLFTPDWIVRYMVENSLGRLWIEGHPNDDLKSEWNYYLDEAEQEPEVEEQLDEIRKKYATLKPEDIKCIDPCCGSGHILVYMFDVLLQIYKSYGYTTKEAVCSIVTNNLYGLDIDERAAQLAYFSVMMKARSYDSLFLNRKVQPSVYAICESNDLNQNLIEFFVGKSSKIQKDFEVMIDNLRDAKEYGSILNITPVDFAALYARVNELEQEISFEGIEVQEKILPLIQVAESLAQKYNVVVTNPPYMGGSSFTQILWKYLKGKYPKSCADLFAAFIEKGLALTYEYGFISMITPQSWLFLSSFVDLRNTIINSCCIKSLASLGTRAFDSGFGTAAWILDKGKLLKYKGYYVTLDDYPSLQEKEKELINKNNRYLQEMDLFRYLPNKVFAYWCSEVMANIFKTTPQVKDIYTLESGIKTGKNNLFLRLWYEVSIEKTCTGELSKNVFNDPNINWFRCNKGSGYHKWYGGLEYVIKMGLHGFYIKQVVNKNIYRLREEKNYMKYGLTWPHIGDTRFSCKLLPSNVLNDVAADAIYTESGKPDMALMSYFNTKVFNGMLKIINPTINYPLDSIGNAPVLPLLDEESIKPISLAKENIIKAKNDWDSFETSWDFQCHPLVRWSKELLNVTSISAMMNYYYRYFPEVKSPLELCFLLWQGECEDRFGKLKSNEEELNQIYINIYGLQDELTPEVEDKDITVRKADLQRDIKSLISYAVGCMFGRYSLDIDGLAYAGGKWDDSKYQTYKPDYNGILPICDDEYFTDDIVGHFIDFVQTVYGKDTLEENLQFIADALGGNGTSREVIRKYFLNDFFADHCKIYQKRPIYWLFDSGKKNGFKCLIYLHRYQPDTIARIRTDYIHEQQARYQTAIADLEKRIGTASTSDCIKLSKELKKVQEQADELHNYEEKIHHLADQYIDIDLDDGVKANFAKFQDVLAKIK